MEDWTVNMTELAKMTKMTFLLGIKNRTSLKVTPFTSFLLKMDKNDNDFWICIEYEKK